LCGNRSDASDLVQEALVRVLARPHRSWDVASVEGYVRRTMLNHQPRDLVTVTPRNVQIIYLKDGLVVGGGPLLREPGDTGLQVTDFAGQGMSAAPGKPGTIDVGPRNTLCPSTSWRDVWADPGEYEVVVTMAEPVNAGPGSPLDSTSYNLIDRKSLS
jgi:hypothetical protein